MGHLCFSLSCYKIASVFKFDTSFFFAQIYASATRHFLRLFLERSIDLVADFFRRSQMLLNSLQ